MLENFTLITGPCAAESMEQVLQTAQNLKQLLTQPFIFRAGVWKPRTRPSSFQGMGAPALSWLQQVKRDFSVPIAIEVGLPEHVELALKNDIDYVWLGARTTTSPFLMDALAASLRSTHLKVIIKNPINPEWQLWAGAVERLMAAQIKDITLVHRGFSVYHESNYRYVPFWEIPLKMKQEFGLPMLCDPGHISRSKDQVTALSVLALRCGFNGLMIESHYQPNKALSDATMQFTPAHLFETLKQISQEYNLAANGVVEMDITPEHHRYSSLQNIQHELASELRKLQYSTHNDQHHHNYLQ